MIELLYVKKEKVVFNYLGNMLRILHDDNLFLCADKRLICTNFKTKISKDDYHIILEYS